MIICGDAIHINLRDGGGPLALVKELGNHLERFSWLLGMIAVGVVGLHAAADDVDSVVVNLHDPIHNLTDHISVDSSVRVSSPEDGGN